MMKLLKPCQAILILFLVLPAYADVTAEQEESAKELLAKNGVETDNQYRITRYLAYKNGGGMISVQQLHDGLVVFDSELAFHFRDGGELVRAQDGSAKLMGIHQDVDELVVERDELISQQEAFEAFAERAKVVILPNMTGDGPVYTIPGPDCAQDPGLVEATLGIYSQMVVWRVWCHEDHYPRMYIDAITGLSLSFDSGIRS